MSITNELREQLLYHLPTADAGLTAIIDRIDAEHQKAEDEWKAKNGDTWLRGYAECHAELMEGNEVIAADLEKAGWVRLPKDADGEPIHLGDVIQFVNEQGGTGAKVEVDAISEHYAYYDEGKHFYKASMCRHYHEPTVEDVLREFAKCWDDPAHYAKGELVETFAKKLREVVEHDRD